MTQIVLFIVGGIQILRGNFTIGMFTIFLSYFNMMMTSMRYFFTLGANYQQTLVAYDRVLEILDKIIAGNGTLEDIDKLEELSEIIISSSLCGLGQTAPNPILSTLKYFREEYIAHVVDKKCPAGVCTNLLEYYIIPEKCVGCTLCKRVCPVDAISGNVKEVHVIDTEKCIKCDACVPSCKKFNAIIKR